MAQEAGRTQEVNVSPRKRQAIARFMVAAVSVAGLSLIAGAALYPGFEPRLFPMLALAFALGPLTADLERSPRSRCIHLPLRHCVLFASALALGPYGAALPGAASGIARLLFGQSPDRPLRQVLHAVLRPIAVCAAAALAYSAAGGDAFYPQSLDSMFAILFAATAYVAASAAAARVFNEPTSGADATNGATGSGALFALAAAWLACLTGGCLLAILYSVVPPYVLCTPALALMVVHLALREPRCSERSEAPEEQILRCAQNDRGCAQNDLNGAGHGVAETDSGVFVDPATGLASRRYLEMFLAGEASRAQRSRKPLSVAVFDLDSLKTLTEEGGRDAVDAAVRITADVIKSGLRDYDLVARYSAGRLVVVLPETSTETAVEIAERLHDLVTRVEFPTQALRATVGIATLPEQASNADELINAAHHALNRGRFTGSNRVHSYQDLAKAG